MKDLIHCNKLCYEPLFSSLSFTIPKSSVTFISGKSGSGKSTLLKLLNQSQLPHQGSILYGGVPISQLCPITLRKSILLVSQDVFLFEESILENFHKFYDFREIPPLSTAQMTYFLTLCQLSYPLDKQASTLSGGEKQRLYLAIFLSFAQNVLLLDEPTSSLDFFTGKQVLSQIISYCKEKQITLLIVSHEQGFIDTFAETIIPIGG